MTVAPFERAPQRAGMIRRFAFAGFSLVACAAVSAAVPPYVAADGSFRIDGAAEARPILEQLDRLYAQSHPEARFTLDLRGSSSALPELTHGVTLFAPMARAISAQELVPYAKIVGREPLEIRIAHDAPGAKSLHWYLRQANGRPLDPVVRDYFHLLLSPAGQRIVAGAGYEPLTAEEAGAEHAKLDAVTAAGPAPSDPPQDGSIYLVGDDGMQEFVEKLDALYHQEHPGARFTLNLKGSSTAIGGLIAGVSAIGPMGRDAWSADQAGFREKYGTAPLDVHVGYDGYSHPSGKNPPGIYVNAKNALAGLTVRQIAQIFTSAAPEGAVTQWSQLGGSPVSRGIHLYGPPDDGGFATAFRLNLLGARRFARGYRSLPKNADVAQAVARDPWGIGLISYFDAKAARGVRLVPIARAPGMPAVLPTYDEVHAGHYPLVPFLRFYAVRAPGHPLDGFARDYARLALSPAGQRILADERGDEGGYVPLNPADLAAERAKLQ